MTRKAILPTGREVAHQALLTIAVTIVAFLIISQVPGVKAWLKQSSEGLPLV
ncbi:hypothetical protein [Roseateles sp.]|uniref:hypothetical protein n=1 Tax=Roseateles sp. TaxID=1971397 RepID=UPI002E04972F|nr:hypothetical protein [Roseateles sp.]